MGELVFKINGEDMLPYIPAGGISWKRNDVDSADAGEMSDGTLRRSRVIMRRTMEITLMDNLSTAEISKIMKLIYPEWFDVEFLDPLEGKVITRKCYANNVPAMVMREAEGKAQWGGFTFPIIEQGVSE